MGEQVNQARSRVSKLFTHPTFSLSYSVTHRMLKQHTLQSCETVILWASAYVTLMITITLMKNSPRTTSRCYCTAANALWFQTALVSNEPFSLTQSASCWDPGVPPGESSVTQHIPGPFPNTGDPGSTTLFRALPPWRSFTGQKPLLYECVERTPQCASTTSVEHIWQHSHSQEAPETTACWHTVTAVFYILLWIISKAL